MPEFFSNTNIVVVTEDELVPVHYNTYGALAQALYRAEKRGYGIKRVMRGGNARELLVEFDSLPRQIRESFKDPRVAEHPLEQFYAHDPEAQEFYGGYKYKNGLYLSDDLQEKYITNASVLIAATSLKDARERERLSKMGSLVGVMRTIHFDVITFNDILQKTYNIQHSLPQNERRFADKFNEFQRDGFPCLINKNLGNRNATVATDETVQLLNNIFAEPAYKPTYSDVSRQYEAFLSGYVEVVNTRTGEVYDPKEFKKLSKSTVYNYLSSWENRVATHTVRSADRQVNMTKYRPAFNFEQPEFSGSLLSIDDRQPPFKYGDNKRAWFYLAEDVASQAITCWVHGTTKEGMIINFYRQLVRNYHQWGLPMPAELECESSLNASFKNTFLKEGSMFQYVKIEANNARAKAIESQVNRQLRYQFEKLENGWQGRPFARDESNQPSPTRDKATLQYGEIVEMALSKIEDFNNSPHVRAEGVSKWEYFLQNQNPNLKPTNYRSFIKHLGYHTESTCRVGKIQFNNGSHVLANDGKIALGDNLINLMKQVEGRPVDVYWLDANDGSLLCAYVYMQGGDTLICEAMPIPKPQKARIEQTEEDVALFELFQKYVATVDGYNSRQRKALDKIMATPTDKVPECQPKQIFRINGANPAAPADNVDDTNNENIETHNGVEILPDAPTDDFDLINIETPYKQSLKDRF